jgi:hypothetical protein
VGERSLGAHSGLKSDIAQDSKSVDIVEKSKIAGLDAVYVFDQSVWRCHFSFAREWDIVWFALNDNGSATDLEHLTVASSARRTSDNAVARAIQRFKVTVAEPLQTSLQWKE